MNDLICISSEEAEEIIAFVKMFERDEIPFQEEIRRQYIQSRNRTMSQLRQQKYLRARMQA